MSPYKLKLLVKTTSELSGCTEVKYMMEGEEGLKIWGKKTSSGKVKLSSLITQINRMEYI